MKRNYLIEKVFENRGYTKEYFDSIDVPDYDSLMDSDVLITELKDIHDSQDVIVVYPDFDMDGVAAGSCGFAGMAELGFNVRLFIPNPSAGYGISVDSIKDVMSLHPDTKAIITCDTGIECGEAADYCRSIGVKFYVTDHHKQTSVYKEGHGPNIIVDPMRLDEKYSHPFICGAFVFYQVLQKYADVYCDFFMQNQIRRLRVFAGIGTVSDVMPLLYENRQIVRDAIDICRLIYGDGSYNSVAQITGCEVYKRAFWGLYELMKVYEEKGTIKTLFDINEEFFGFYLAPAVNSVKRMDGDMKRAFGVFFGNDRTENMEYLCDLNNARKVEVTRALDAINNSDQPYAPYIYMSDARPGILGLIAQKITSNTGLPTVVLTVSNDGEVLYHGSGRSPEWYPFFTKISGKVFVGGHETSFGCGVKSDDELKMLFDFLNKDVPDVYTKIASKLSAPKPDYVISTDWSKDVGIDLSVFEEFLDQLDDYRPFGKGFAFPTGRFEFRNSDVVIPDGKKTGWEVMGKAKQHLKIHFPNGFDVVLWNQAHLITEKDVSETHAVVGSLKYSEFRGVKSVIFDGTLVKS